MITRARFLALTMSRFPMNNFYITPHSMKFVYSIIDKLFHCLSAVWLVLQMLYKYLVNYVHWSNEAPCNNIVFFFNNLFKNGFKWNAHKIWQRNSIKYNLNVTTTIFFLINNEYCERIEEIKHSKITLQF